MLVVGLKSHGRFLLDKDAELYVDACNGSRVLARLASTHANINVARVVSPATWYPPVARNAEEVVTEDLEGNGQVHDCAC